MRTMMGPGVFLAQFARDEAPFDSIEGLAGWAAGKGFKGVQIPTWDKRTIDLARVRADLLVAGGPKARRTRPSCRSVSRYPTVVDGAAGVAFVDAAIRSAASGTWADCALPPV